MGGHVVGGPVVHQHRGFKARPAQYLLPRLRCPHNDLPHCTALALFQEGRRRCSPLPSPDDLAAFFAASPAAHVDRVTAPVFLMLGAKDRRWAGEGLGPCGVPGRTMSSRYGSDRSSCGRR